MMITRQNYLRDSRRGSYIVLADDGKHVGLVSKRDDGWQSWIFRPERNRKLSGTFKTRREAAAEIFTELAAP